MKRREFLKLLAAGATPLTLSMLCNLPTENVAITPTAKAIRQPTPFPPEDTPNPIPTQIMPGATPTVGPVPAPAQGLGSNFNYHLHSDCKPVTGLSVTIEITKEIVTDIGLGIQLNAYSPQGANCVWQQYGFELKTSNDSPLDISGLIDNWPSPGFSKVLDLPESKNMINHHAYLVTLPGATLPAGYKFTITLKYDQKENVNGVDLSVVDNQGKVSNLEIMLESLTYVSQSGKGKPVTTDGLAPIYAFELNLVGPVNSKDSFLTSGAGTITYTSTSPLFVANKDPQCTAARTTITAEQANTTYASLLPGPSKEFKQNFEIEMPNPFQAGNPVTVSRESGRNQTDLFVVSSAGQLNVFSAEGNGHWREPRVLGPVGMARPGTFVAASIHDGGENQADVFLINQDGQLTVFSLGGSGAWNGPESIGAHLEAHLGDPLAVSQHFGVNKRTDVFLINKNGQLDVFWSTESGKWNGPESIGAKEVGNFKTRITVSKHFGVDDQSDIFLLDLNGQLNVFSAAGSGKWGGPQKIGPAGLSASGAAISVSQKPGTTDQTQVFLVDNHGQLRVFTCSPTGKWSEPAKVGPQSIAPAGAPVAAVLQAGPPGQTDVFVIKQTGAGGAGWPAVYWSSDGIEWSGPKELVHEI